MAYVFRRKPNNPRLSNQSETKTVLGTDTYNKVIFLVLDFDADYVFVGQQLKQ